MDLLEMTARIQSEVGDDTEAHITKVDIHAWLNEAQLQVARLTTFPEGHSTFTTDGRGSDADYDSRGYELPDDTIVLRMVQRDLSFPEKTTFERLPQYGAVEPQQTGTINYWYIYNRKLHFYPEPVAGNFVQLYYARRPAIMTEAAPEPELPLSIHNDMLLYAKQRAMEFQEEYDSAGYFAGQFILQTGKSHYEVRNQADDAYPMVRSIDELEWGGWSAYG